MQHCQSCAMPLEKPRPQSPDPRDCAHCAADDGKLRAEICMKSMPAWAD